MKYLMLHFSYSNQFDLLDDQQLGSLIRMAMEYAEGKESPGSDDPYVKMAFSFMQGNIDREQEAYRRRVESSRANGKKGGRPKSE